MKKQEKLALLERAIANIEICDCYFSYNENYFCYLNGAASMYCQDNRDELPKLEMWYQALADWDNSSFACWANANSDIANKICKSITGKSTYDYLYKDMQRLAYFF